MAASSRHESGPPIITATVSDNEPVWSLSATLPEAQPPFWRDFLTSAGFGGTMALLAAAVAAAAAIYAACRTAESHKAALDQQDRHHCELRDDGRRSAAITRCWDRLVWLVNTASAQPATADASSAHLRVGPELAQQLLEVLEGDADELQDRALAKAVNLYVVQFGLVLTQQIGTPAQPTDEPSAGA